MTSELFAFIHTMNDDCQWREILGVNLLEHITLFLITRRSSEG